MITANEGNRSCYYYNCKSCILSYAYESIGVGCTAIHKKFGKGTVVKINKNEKFIHIKFTLGEKKFIFPDAFLMGFLEV